MGYPTSLSSTEMAKFRCVCGHIISTSGDMPNHDEWLLLSDVEFDNLGGAVEVEDLYRQLRHAYKCPTSDHLWIFWNGLDAAPSLYSPEPLPEGWE
jgi:hypothetical protein